MSMELQQSREQYLAEGKTGDVRSSEGREQAHRHMGEMVGKMGLEKESLRACLQMNSAEGFIEKTGTWLVF